MILGKTERGQQALKARSVKLSARQRSAFILFDGRRSVDQVLEATAGTGITTDEIMALVEEGFLTELAVAGHDGVAGAAPSAHVPQPDGAAAPVVLAPLEATARPSARSAQERYRDAYPVATRLTAALGLRGFRLNLAVEGVSSYEELVQLAPKIRSAVGEGAYAELDRALNG